MFRKLQLELPGDQEVSCREFYFQKDIRQVRLGILLFAVPLILFAFNDLQLLGLSTEFYGVIALRLGLLFFTIFEVVQIGKVKSFRKYDQSITVYSLILLIFSGIINATRPQNFIVHILITIIAVFVVYLLTPNRLANQILIASTATIGEAVIILWFQQPSSMPYLFTIFFGLLLTNVIAVFGSWQLQTYRRKSFIDLTKNFELQRELEKHSKNLEEIVEKKTMELRKAERMATIGQLAAMVGHDLRNPLSSIVNASYYLKKKAGSKLDQKEVEMIETIETSVAHSNKIINDLLDYSKEIKLDLSETNPKSLLEDSLTLLQVPEKIDIEKNLKEEPKFEVDKDKMIRVFVNLIRNAFEAMPNGGTLTIRSGKDDDNVFFSFEDAGVGMSEDTLQNLWIPLFTTKPKGMGLGLPICKRFVEAHNGTITVSSIPDKGTKFLVKLPIKREYARNLQNIK